MEIDNKELRLTILEDDLDSTTLYLFREELKKKIPK